MATKHGVRSLKLWFPNATRRVSRIQRSRSETNTFPPRGVSPECLPEVWWSWLGPMNELSNLERALELLQQLGLKEYESQAFVALSRPPAWDGQTDQRISDVPALASTTRSGCSKRKDSSRYNTRTHSSSARSRSPRRSRPCGTSTTRASNPSGGAPRDRTARGRQRPGSHPRGLVAVWGVGDPVANAGAD